MKIPAALRKAVSTINPLNLKDLVMNALLKSILKKALSSLTKGGIAVVIVALTGAASAIAGFDTGNDQLVVWVAAGLTALVHAAISALKRFATYDATKAL